MTTHQRSGARTHGNSLQWRAGSARASAAFN